MITVNRKVAILLAFILLIVSSSLSVFYYYSSVHNYLTRLEGKLSMVTNSYNQMRLLERESEMIAELKDELNNSYKVTIEGTLTNLDLEKVMKEIVTSKVVEIDYFSITSESQFPIVFEDTPVIYQVSIVTGVNANGNQ
ncbi:MAG TPA: hypothetical protein PL174_07445 [Fervidobacterium sp.]|nr:hypothetical protein [Thermotogaceae bacterium]HOA16843.1 hypothetical protein [Fervidobacterium sp.]HOH53333.1 hypothetical protein [Fervidobacterium sp.]HOK34319.1 hypothetical protein [Fervidobacterium sp.]HOL04387.1 hypothetical protein [Fervidobacterium sp.]